MKIGLSLRNRSKMSKAQSIRNSVLGKKRRSSSGLEGKAPGRLPLNLLRRSRRARVHQRTELYMCTLMVVVGVMGRKERLLESGCTLVMEIAGEDALPFGNFTVHLPFPRNVSEALKGELQTNQRAELTAIQRALEIVPRDRDIHIYTDSNYSINCSTVWYVNWKKNNWTTAQHEPVMNKDLILAIRALIDERDAKGSKTHMEWVKGHDKNPGNEAADKLAVTGSMARRS